MKRKFYLLLVWLLLAAGISAQVTVGADKKPEIFSVLEVTTKTADRVDATLGGLRLPQLTTAQRNAWRDYFLGTATGNPVKPSGSVTADELVNAPGLAIFNTDTKCYEYWNGLRWVSLCEGDSQLTIYPDPCPDVLADGTGCDDEFDVTDPDCVIGPFSFAIIIGGDYAALTGVDELEGRFRITFRENNTIRPRTVVVRVTSSCTGLSKDFMFIQQGQKCNDALGEAPKITVTPDRSDLSYCAGGAVYLSVPADTPNLDVLIWTLNGIEIARGVNFLEVTREGRYDIHMGAVGCNQLDGNAVMVTRDGTGAPLAPSVVVQGNNGLVCDDDEKTQLVAMNPNSGGTVLWFKDGVLQDGNNGTDNITGTLVDAGIGEWFAVVQDGNCLSRKSPTVTVKKDPFSGTWVDKPELDDILSFCAGSSVLLNVNDDTYNSTYTYTWYENSTQIGTGRSLLYNVPGGVPSVVVRCRATSPNKCAKEALLVKTITTGPLIATPNISGNTVLCSGTALLNVLPVYAGSYSYAWYKDNTLIGTTQTITVDKGGDYYATVTDGCTSPRAHINISDISSAAPLVTLNSSAVTPGQANVDDKITYNAVINFGPATGYVWDIPSDIADLLQGGGPGDSYAIVRYTTVGTGTIKVTVTNACGFGEGSRDVTVSACGAVVKAVSPAEPTAKTIPVDVQLPLGPVTAIFSGGSPIASYQWYSNDTDSNTGGTEISGATNPELIVTLPTPGTAYYYCEVDNAGCPGSPKASGVFTVNVVAAPTVVSPPATFERCKAGTLTLTATASDGAEIRWYDEESGGTVLGTGPSFTTPSLTETKTYYVAAFTPGLDYESPRTAVIAMVDKNIIIEANGGSVASQGTVTLSATASEGSVVYWQTSSATGTSKTNSGNTWVTPTLSDTKTYWARPWSDVCNAWGTAKAVTATVTHPTSWTGSNSTSVTVPSGGGSNTSASLSLKIPNNGQRIRSITVSTSSSSSSDCLGSTGCENATTSGGGSWTYDANYTATGQTVSGWRCVANSCMGGSSFSAKITLNVTVTYW
jgi:hypothetical protein